MITNYARYTCEIKSRISVAKAAFNNKETLFSSKLDTNLKGAIHCRLNGAILLCDAIPEGKPE